MWRMGQIYAKSCSELKELFVCVIPGEIGWPDLAKIYAPV